MTLLLQLAAAFVGSAGFALLFSVKKEHLLYGGLGGLLAWLVFSLLAPVIASDVIRYVVTSALFTFYAYGMAKLRHAPATVFIVPSAVPLFPGSLLYYSMEAAVNKDWALFGERGVHTLALAAAIACGILVTMAVISGFKQHQTKK